MAGSRYGEVRLALGAEERVFRLGLGQIRAIEEKCDAGLPELAQRLAPMMQIAAMAAAAPDEAGAFMMKAILEGALGTWRVDDYREVIYQALVGGGETPTMAGLIVKASVDERAPLEMAVLAFNIILAALLGPEDEPLGETKGAKPPPKNPRSRAARPAG
jgi:hypothetical protein